MASSSSSVSPSKSFQVALVTGAAQGIGRGIATRLSEDGLDVGLNDLPSNSEALASLKAEIEAKGRKCIIVTADISNEDQVKNMIDTTVKDLGRLDVMVANAGISLTPAPILQATVKDWDTVFAINARGTFLCYKYAALQMVAQGKGGRIIGASSIVGKRAEPGLAAYCATKAAIRSLTQATALELGTHGITVNAFAPGLIGTPMVDKLAEIVVQMGIDQEVFYQSEANKCIMGRVGTPQDIANLVSFFASPNSDYITGQTINCDGGRLFD